MKRTAMFLLGFAGLVALTLYAGAGAVGRVLATLGFGGLLLIALLHLPVLVLMGVAWWSAGRPAGARSSFITARFIRDAAGEVLPFSQLGGFAIGIRALGLMGVDLPRSASSMFADLVMEFTAKLPYTAAGLLVLITLLPDTGLLPPLALGLGLAALLITAVVVFRGALLSRLDRIALAVVRKWTQLEDARKAIVESLTPAHLLPCFALHVFCWFLGAAETWVIFKLMRAPVTPAQALVIDSLANALRTFGFFVPAAAGVQEGAYIAVCALFGIGPAQAVAFSLTRRAREIVLGLPGLAVWQVLETRRPSGAVEIIGRKSQPPA